jgi:hypothetical protein
MKQLTLQSFFTSSPGGGAKRKSQKASGNAKDILEPLFIRPIPPLPKYQIQLEEEYELIDKNNFTQVFVQVCTILELIRRADSARYSWFSGK